MRRLASITVIFAIAFTASIVTGGTAFATVTCTQTGFFRDSINMTAAQIGGT